MRSQLLSARSKYNLDVGSGAVQRADTLREVARLISDLRVTFFFCEYRDQGGPFLVFLC